MWETVLRLMGWSRPDKPKVVEAPQAGIVPVTEVPSGPVTPSLFEIASGDNNLQVGYAGGDVVSHVTHHTHTHRHITIIQAPTLAPANEPPMRKPTSGEQSATLRRLNQLHTQKRIRVLDFMESRFGTRMVIELKTDQLNLLNRYLEPVMKDTRNLKETRPARVA